MKFKKLISIVILVLMITSISYAEDNSNMGSVGEGYGTPDFDIRTIELWQTQSVNIPIAKISLWNEETKEIVDSFIVSSYSNEDLQDLRLVSNMTKVEYMELGGQLNDEIKNSLAVEDEYIRVSNIIHIPDFPKLLLKSDEGNVFNKAKEYFSNQNNMKTLLSSFRVDNEDAHKLILVIEPMGIFKVNNETTETLILLTSAEIGLLSYNKHQMFNCYIHAGEMDIMPFTSYYYTQLYQVIPFSTFKTNKEKLVNILPCNNKYKNSTSIRTKYNNSRQIRNKYNK